MSSTSWAKTVLIEFAVALRRRHRAAAAAADRPRRAPVARRERDRARGGVVRRVRVDPLVDRGGERERLEGRSRLPLALRGEVELAVVVGGGGGHRQDLAGLRVGRDQRGRGAEVTGCAAIASRASVWSCGIDRGVDLEPAEPDSVRPVLLDQLLLDVVEEVLLTDLVVARAALEAEAAAHHLLVLGHVDVALLLHRIQHQIAALGGPLGVDERVVLRGRLRQPGEQCGLASP